MSNAGSRYWFYIDSFIHMSANKSSVLFYNPYTGVILEIQKNTTISKLVRRLNAPKNLRVIRLSYKDLQNPVINSFIADIRNNFMGDLLDESLTDSKPFQMPPDVKILKDLKYLKSDQTRSTGENIMNYIEQVAIYINNICSQNCSFCKNYYRQMVCCTSSNSPSRSLEPYHLEFVLDEIKDCQLTDIEITGGNILEYPWWKQLDSLLNKMNTRKTFYLHCKNAAGHLEKLNRFRAKNLRLKLLVTFPISEEYFKLVRDQAVFLGLDVTPVFIIRGEKEYENAEELLSKYPYKTTSFFPFFDGDNLEFFKNNFFIHRKDIEAAKPTLRDIYVNSQINSAYFGKLVILPNGSIHTDVNEKKLGELGNDSIRDCIMKEFEESRSWMKLRKNVNPCRHCNFEKLCPPISNYNKVIGRYNLCHIHSSSS